MYHKKNKFMKTDTYSLSLQKKYNQRYCDSYCDNKTFNRTLKIEELKKQIIEGSYYIEEDKVARKILEYFGIFSL
ncbi:MAG: flagellar biosynthesis anti-sigma factor FlgM [Candidatus Eremiobacterota bacterium]